MKKCAGKISLVDRTEEEGVEMEKEIEEQDTADFINNFFSNIGP